MCMPKAPKQDPAIKQAQERQRALEAVRMAEEKKKQLAERKRQLGGSGVRSLISGGGSGFGSNY